jgi:hypothetical protein
MLFSSAELIQAVNENDFCVNATAIAINVTVYGNFSNATVDSADVPGTCDLSDTPANYPGLWYKVVGTGQRLEARSCDFPDNQYISVYNGTCGLGNLQCVVKGYGPCGEPRLQFDSVEGTTYYILHISNKANALIDLKISLPTPEKPCGFFCSVRGFFQRVVGFIFFLLFLK